MELFFFLMGGVKVIAQRYKFPHTFKIFVLGIFPALFTCCHKARQFILFPFPYGKGTPSLPDTLPLPHHRCP